eukprot:scaffold7.g3429.t1
MRKKVDSRIRTLVENGVKLRQRSLFVVVGDKGRDQVVNLHYMLSKTVVKARPSVLCKLESLTQLYSLTMDVHARLRTESHQAVTGRFNERLVLSLASCPAAILMDDELNILPTSTHVKHIQPLPTNADGTPAVEAHGAAAAAELADLAASLADTQPAGALVGKCRTLDQAKAVVTFLDAASEKTLRATVALTAARGRGKSAALGLAVAGALALGYSNVFVTAPSPENLRTLFEFVFRGLDELGYKEHIDYDLVESTNPAFGRAVVRYIQPQHHAKLAQAELLVIDEAAAIPLPLVKAMLGPYLVFLCSTVNGYEGTGRSLSLKLIQQLRAQGAKLASGGGREDGGSGGAGARTFREVILSDPIRYASGDKVERWLNELLCLDAAEHMPPPPPRLPHPDECELYYVERDTLFSYHKASELFLQRMMSLYVASHYKNTPNDLLLMSDAPAHRLFVLLGPVDETQASGGAPSTAHPPPTPTRNALPDVLAVVQVALEGHISRRSAKASLAAGQLPQGDLIPWTVGQQFQDPDFPSLSGARVVRIAVHPEVARAGALSPTPVRARASRSRALHSYGTRALELLRRYYEGELADVMSEGEGDETAAAGGGGAATAAAAGAPGGGGLLEEQLKPRTGLPPLLVNLAERPADFRGRFMGLLAGAFRGFAPALVLSVLDPRLSWGEAEAQAAILACVGLQQHDVSAVEAALDLPASQVLALFNKAVRRLHGHLRAAKEAEVERSLPRPLERTRLAALAPHEANLDEELDAAAQAIKQQMQQALRPEELAQFAVAGQDADFEAAVGGAELRAGGVVSVRAAGGGAKAGKDAGRKRKEGGGGGGTANGRQKKGGGGSGGKPKKKQRA